MSNWQYTLDLLDIWEEHRDREMADIEYPNQGKRIAQRIRAAGFFLRYKDDLEEIALQFEAVTDVTSFNHAANQLWDWGDSPLPTKAGEMQRKRCWIKTF